MLQLSHRSQPLDRDTEAPPGGPLSVSAALTVAHAGSLVDRRYRIVREIASGGGGVVFEAEHLHTKAHVAIKTLNLARVPRGAPARLLREARALGLVRHPNVVRVLDAGECQTHGPFVALELIDGRTLESFVTGRSRLGVATTIALVCQLADALAALAARGVVHRDVKPANVLVVPGEGRPDTAILIDLGIARIQGDPDGSRVTLSGELLGTPEYMSPEQATSAVPVDHRTDVYGLGVLTYECLTGTTPFSGHVLEVVSSILSGAEPAPMSRHRTDVPPELEAVVRRALRQDRDARWPDAASFARACVAAMGGGVPDLHLFHTEEKPPETARTGSVRRRVARAPYHAPARLLLPSGVACDAKIEDISCGGLLITTREELAPEVALSIKLALPLSGHVLVLPSVVRWVRKRAAARAAGLEFRNLPPDARREIELYVKPLD